MREALETTKAEKLHFGAMPFEDQQAKQVWRALGSYIAKQMISGKAVVIQKFGLFTYSAPEVKLAGTTNPHQRDKQNRELVFVVRKDFCSGVMRRADDHIGDINLKAGVCSGDAIRPNEVRGTNGIVPHQKINYLDVA